MESDLNNLEPSLLWRHFDALAKIPRCSGDEAAARAYVIAAAERLGHDYVQDDAGNVVVRRPAAPGHAEAPTVVLQSHLDMVCEKADDVAHDFARDPISLSIEGAWLTAAGTTLGADNGIGAAAALAALEEQQLVHGPLEALFTVDEERGLNGIKQLDPALLRGRKLFNLDGDEEGVLFVGCAGGGDSHVTLPVTRREADGQTMRITLGGLRGGHSGIEIDKGGGNAIRLLAQILYRSHLAHPFSVVSLFGGDKMNAIPRMGRAVILVPPGASGQVETALRQQFSAVKGRYQAAEPAMNLVLESAAEAQGPLRAESQTRLFGLLLGYPVGVIAMHQDLPGLVETSNNLSRIRVSEEAVRVSLSSRSSDADSLAALRAQIRALSEALGATVEQPEGYPAWQPDLESPLLGIARECYEDVFGETPAIRAVHAGVEPAVIGRKVLDMEMLSFGPTIRNAHSPHERVEIDSVRRFWSLLRAMLEVLARW